MKLKQIFLFAMIGFGTSASAQTLGVVNGAQRPFTMYSNDHYTRVKETCFAGVDVEDKNGVLTVIEYVRLATKQEVDLKPGDVIRSVNDISLKNKKDWEKAMDGFKPGETVTLKIDREGSPKDVKVKLEKMDVFAKEI